MYNVSFINPLIQFGISEYDALIEDDANILPSNRLHIKFNTEEVTDDMFTSMTQELIAMQMQLNYSATNEAINTLREAVDEATTEIIDQFLTKDLDTYRASLSDPQTTIEQAVGYIINAYITAAQQVLSQIPDPH